MNTEITKYVLFGTAVGFTTETNKKTSSVVCTTNNKELAEKALIAAIGACYEDLEIVEYTK